MKLGDRDKIISYLEKKTIQIEGCWMYYGGSKSVDGYRHIIIDGRRVGVHRLSAHIFLGLDLDDKVRQANHKNECPSKVCWNPEHLYVGTHKQNIQDYLGKGHYNKVKTHCKYGHPLTASTTAGHRQCRICKRRTSKLYNTRTKK